MAKKFEGKWNEKTYEALASGHEENVLNAMRSTAIAPDADFVELAANAKHWNVVKHALKNNFPAGPNVTLIAIAADQLGVLGLLRKNGMLCKECVCTMAAVHGRFNVLKWLRRVGCEWDVTTTGCAAVQGHMDILDWAVCQGCPYSYKIMGDRPEVLKWLSTRPKKRM